MCSKLETDVINFFFFKKFICSLDRNWDFLEGLRLETYWLFVFKSADAREIRATASRTLNFILVKIFC